MISVRPELVEGSRRGNHIDNFNAVMVRQAPCILSLTKDMNGLGCAIPDKSGLATTLNKEI